MNRARSKTMLGLLALFLVAVVVFGHTTAFLFDQEGSDLHFAANAGVGNQMADTDWTTTVAGNQAMPESGDSTTTTPPPTTVPTATTSTPPPTTSEPTTVTGTTAPSTETKTTTSGTATTGTPSASIGGAGLPATGDRPPPRPPPG